MRGARIWGVIGFVLWSGIGAAQEEAPEAAPRVADYAEVLRGVDADLADVLERLAAQRSAMAEERPALARETNEIAAEVREKRRRAELARQERDALIHDLGEFSRKVKVLRDEKGYVESLLADFRKQLEAEMGIAEVEMQRERFLASERGGAEGFTAMLELAELAAGRLEELGGPRVYSGEALDAGGIARPGSFVEAGPVSWFFSDDEKVAGLVTESRNLNSEVVPGTGNGEAIRDLASGRPASPRFDPTLGAAAALGEAGGTVIDHIRKGGFWIYPILLLAVIATAAAVAKWFQLMRIREMRPGVVKRVVEAVNSGNSEGALGELAAVRHPAAAVLERGVEMGGRSHDDIEEALYERYLEAQPKLQRGLPLIAIASATAPLLGLLGTVTGMIHTFKLINLFGTGDARSLSSGISEALVTTEFGLVVAIPALILHALLSRKIQGIRSAMEMTSLAFVNGLKTRSESG